MNVYTVGRLATGLNNQRMCLTGLLSTALADSGRIVLPTELEDYTPRVNGAKRASKAIPFAAVFDEMAVRVATATILSEHQKADVCLDTQSIFKAGTKALRRSSGSDIVSSFFMSLGAAPGLKQTSDTIAHWLDEQSSLSGRTIATHLRIERSWINYLRSRNAADADPETARTSDPAVIFAKIRSTPDMADVSNIWACCDEADVLQPKSDIKGLAAGYGFRLLFKSDLPQFIRIPDSLLQRSMIDYTICRAIPTYVGLNRSTFSQMLYLTSRWLHEEKNHYLYNVPGDILVRQALS